MHLAVLTASVTEIPLTLTPEMRGKELSLEEVCNVAGDPVTYVVSTLSEFVAEYYEGGLRKTLPRGMKAW